MSTSGSGNLLNKYWVPRNGLLHQWMCKDDVASGGTLVDWNGGNNGMLAGNAAVTGSRLVLDGTGDWATCGSVQFPHDAPWSVNCFARFVAFGAASSLMVNLSNPGAPDRTGISMYTVGTNLYLFMPNLTGTVYVLVSGSTTLQTATTYMLTATYDGSGADTGVKLYVNGALETPTNQGNGNPGTQLAKTLYFGTRMAGTYSLNGSLWNLATWNRVLLAAELPKIYQGRA